MEAVAGLGDCQLYEGDFFLLYSKYIFYAFFFFLLYTFLHKLFQCNLSDSGYSLKL